MPATLTPPQPATKPTPSVAPVAAASAPPRWACVGISVLLIAHLTAVFIAPFHFTAATSAQEAGAPLTQPVFGLLKPYLDVTFLNHGYHFFAPDPGASHVVVYEIKFADGAVQRGQFPDRNQHWPRLLYHRHFMLTEFIAMGMPPDLNTWMELPMAEGPQHYVDAYAAHLLASHPGAKQVTLWMRRRFCLDIDPGSVERGKPIDSLVWTKDKPLGVYTTNGRVDAKPTLKEVRPAELLP